MGYTFTPQTTYAVGSGPVSMTTADVNGDGHADLIVANYAKQHDIGAAGQRHGHVRRADHLRGRHQPGLGDDGGRKRRRSRQYHGRQPFSRTVSVLLNTSTPASSLDATSFTFDRRLEHCA